MVRERVACVVPGASKAGLSLWVVEDKFLVKVAVGSVEVSTLEATLDRFDVDLLVVPEIRYAPFRATTRALQFAHPDWRAEPLTLHLGRMGPLAHNAWRLGFHHLVRRGPYHFRRLVPERLTRDWVEENGPRRIRAAD
jgi:hypothetical protein